TSGRAFTEEDRTGLALFAGQAAIAIENARLFEESTRRGRRLSAILDITKRLARRLDLPAMLTSIVEEAMRLFEVDNAGFRILEGDDLGLAGIAGYAGAPMPPPRLQGRQSLSGKGVQLGRAVRCDLASPLDT